VKNRTQEPAACEIELQNRDTADTGDAAGFPRYALARRACGGTLSEKRGSGGVRSEKGKGSSGVPVTGGARIRWRNRLAGGKLQRKNQGSIFSAGVGEENANERRSAGRASAAARNERQKNNETLVPHGTQENKRRRKP
jgi:hypothetical protein